METMRKRFTAVTTDLLAEHPRLAVVLADISADGFQAGRDPLPGPGDQRGDPGATADQRGGRAVPDRDAADRAHLRRFLVERPFEQIKLDLNHQDAEAGAVLVSSGASYDYSEYGRTHQSPGDVALLDTLPGWTVHVPGHPDEAERQIRAAARGNGLVYLRLSTEANTVPLDSSLLDGEPGRLTVLRRGSRGTVLVVGPLADAVVDATLGLDVTVLYAATIRPLDVATLRDSLQAPDVVLVEPYLAGTSVPAVAEALRDLPHRILGLGVGRHELRRYGTPAEHQAAHGLDPRSLRAEITSFLRV